MSVWKIMPSFLALCLLASCDTVSTGKLRGIWPTCWEPENVKKADLAASQEDWVTWRTMKCGLLGDRGTPVRLIRCAADITPGLMERFSNPVPRDDSLPERICEVEVFYEEGGTGIGYTYFLNIEESP